MDWPNHPGWMALADGVEIEQDDRTVVLRVVDCGELLVASGRIAVCDPFSQLTTWAHYDDPVMLIPPGHYRIHVTQADVSGKGDGSHIRNAYATLFLSDAPETVRALFTPVHVGDDPVLVRAAPDQDGYHIGVDKGTGAFFDRFGVSPDLPIGTLYDDPTCPDRERTTTPWDFESIVRAIMADPCSRQQMEDEEWWHEHVFGLGSKPGWSQQLDDSNHYGEDVANVPLPNAPNGENIVLFSTGWGDGHYALVGGYDASGALVRLHLDFQIVNPPKPFWLGRPPGYFETDDA